MSNLKNVISVNILDLEITTYEFCNEDIKKFILLLRRSVYPYEYMDSW